MEFDKKFFLGVATGLAAAVIIGVVAFGAGQNSNIPVGVMGNRMMNTNQQLKNVDTDTNSETPPKTMMADSDQQTVRGTFGMEHDSLYSDTLCFKTSTAVTGIPAKSFFCFSNQNLAKQSLKVNDAGSIGLVACDHISGQASITISDYSMPTSGGDAPPTAKFITVNKITVPAQCGRGPLNY